MRGRGRERRRRRGVRFLCQEFETSSSVEDERCVCRSTKMFSELQANALFATGLLFPLAPRKAWGGRYLYGTHAICGNTWKNGDSVYAYIQIRPCIAENARNVLLEAQGRTAHRPAQASSVSCAFMETTRQLRQAREGWVLHAWDLQTLSQPDFDDYSRIDCSMPCKQCREGTALSGIWLPLR